MSGPRSIAARVATGLVAPALLLGWWQWQAQQGGSKAIAFVSLPSLGHATTELVADGSLIAAIAGTLGRTFAGLAIGVVLGVAVGVATAVWRLLDRTLSPLLDALRQVPLIGWLPLIGLWFGSDETSGLIVIALSAFFPAMLNAHAGVVGIDRRYIEVGRIYGFTAAQLFRLVLAPAAMPLLLTGVTQALGFAWIAAIATEILTGAGAGLGVTMEEAQTQQRLDIILVVIIVTAALGFLINHAILRLRALLLRWQAPAF